MYVLIRPFIDIAFFRQGPQTLPESRLLLVLALFAHAALGMMLFALRMDTVTAFKAGITGTALLVLLTVSLLMVNGLRTRTVRTLTALTGTDVVIGVIGLPVSVWLSTTSGAHAIDGIAGIAFVVMLIWNLAVAGHVLRHALSAPLPMGVVLALIFFVISVSVMNRLFPDIQ